jgi:two-component system catabolic regulation response regulator CreB
LVEDTPAIAENVALALAREGIDCHHVTLAADGLVRVRSGRFDLAILDVGLPDGNGFELCRTLRGLSDIPVIFLTARSDEIDRLVGLQIGADDFVLKPFSPRELAARVKAILRRRRASSIRALAAAPRFIEVDEERATVSFKGQTLDLSRAEYLMLKAMAAWQDAVAPTAGLAPADAHRLIGILVYFGVLWMQVSRRGSSGAALTAATAVYLGITLLLHAVHGLVTEHGAPDTTHLLRTAGFPLAILATQRPLCSVGSAQKHRQSVDRLGPQLGGHSGANAGDPLCEGLGCHRCESIITVDFLALTMLSGHHLRSTYADQTRESDASTEGEALAWSDLRTGSAVDPGAARFRTSSVAGDGRHLRGNPRATRPQMPSPNDGHRPCRGSLSAFLPSHSRSSARTWDRAGMFPRAASTPRR